MKSKKIDKLAIRVFGLPKYNFKRPCQNKTFSEPLKHSRILVFDTETTIDQYQNLKIGYFKIYQDNILQHKGLIYEEVTEEELIILKNYAKNNKISLYTREEFVDQIFYPEVLQLRTLCVGFNLKFDLSRLAIKFGYARKNGKGGFSFQLSKDKIMPRIKIKQLNSDNYTIKFANSPKNYGENRFQGYFLDIQRLASILTDNKRISLKDSCKLFKTKTQKEEVEEHGKVTKKYIGYLITDVIATYEVYRKVIEEFNKYGVQLPLTKVFSSASIGKQALRQLGIQPFQNLNPNFSSDLLGKLMSAFFGGRTECKIRKTPTKVSTLDFTSMYPSLTILMNHWDYIIPDKIDYIDDTRNVQKLLNKVTSKDLMNKKIWKDLNVLVEIEPNKDILPVRSNYDKKSNSFTIGVNNLACKEPLFYALPDIIASKILTGKCPKIKKAIRFIPIGKQETLTKTDLLGIEINPKTENFIKKIIEKRQEIKKQIKIGKNDDYLKSKQKALKILANSTTYGIFVEINPDDKKEEQIIFSNIQFKTFDNKLENPGAFFNPIVSVMITAGARLLLALAEQYVTSKGHNYAGMDTDSIFVDPKIAKQLSKYFDSLNPYSAKIPFLKIEKENRLFYGIASKRYCLYKYVNNKIIISDDRKDEDYKLHGLGHLMNPFPNNIKDWHREIWLDILKLHYKQITEQDIHEKYSNVYAIAQLTISTASIMKRFEKINKEKAISKQIKPFNFMLVGIGNKKNKDTIKPLAPYSKDSQEAVYNPFIDYKTGKEYNKIEYWQPLSTNILRYIDHKESKFKGDTGILKRRHVKNPKIKHIGKETKNIDKQLIQKPEIEEYQDLRKILDVTPEQARELGVKYRSTLKQIKDKIKQGRKIKITKTVEKLMKSF